MAPHPPPLNSNPSRNEPSRVNSPTFKIALAMALVRFNRLHRSSSSASASSSSSDQLLRWKQKAKERKREIMRLREELKLLQDGTRSEAEPPVVSCRCNFFDSCGEPAGSTGDVHWIDEVLRRRFIRLVRWKERRKRVEGPIQRRNFMEFDAGCEMERLSASIDFLVEISDNVLAKGEIDSSFSIFSHQAIDFILASLKGIIPLRKERETLEEIVNGLIMRLIKRMCTIPNNNSDDDDAKVDSGSLDSSSDPQCCVQHIIRKLGNEQFIGQREMLLVSQKISILSENLLLIDPFDDNFPSLHDNLFLLIQLIEFLISDNIKSWINCENFDKRLFEEWVRSILKSRKDLETLENMNGLYVMYMDRVVGLLAKEVGPAAHQGKLDLQVFSKLLI